VAGIAIALLNINLASVAFILFAANIISIIFVCILIYGILDIHKKRKSKLKIAKRGFIAITISFIMISIPLFLLLRDSAFQTFTINNSDTILRQELKEISPNIEIGKVEARAFRRNSENYVSIGAHIKISEDVIIDFREKQALVSRLEEELGAKIDLKLSLSKTISVVSEEDSKKQEQIEKINQTLVLEIENINSSFSIESIKSNFVEEG
jgi:uncharacterized membrane protein